MNAKRLGGFFVMILKFGNIPVGLRNAATKPIYGELDEKIEKVSKLAYTALVKWTMMGTVLPAFLITGFHYLTSDSEVVTLLLAYPAMYASNTAEAFLLGNIICSISLCSRYPFDWKISSGYLMAFICQFVGSFYIFLTCASVVSFFVGSSWIMEALVKDISKDLVILNRDRPFDRGYGKTKQRLRDTVQHYSVVKQLS